GSGKSTQARLLADRLRREGYRVLLTREPGGTGLGEAIRRILLSSKRMDPASEMLLFQALRAHHAAEVIRPALRAGAVVICDRYADSTMAYQGYGLGVDRQWIEQITREVTQGASPDLTVVLDAAAAAGLKRAARKQRMERRGLSYQQRVLRGFRRIARANPKRCKIVKVMSTPEATQKNIRQAVKDALQRRRRT
ncbi:MAG: dTMP kinase, partial [Candidatus Omnitrophica bacterium]|nr:dTMP kinase [Candidatus Omnitrophota bacterium]